MHVEPHQRPGLHMEGVMQISCGDFQFRVELTPSRIVADFPSFGMLLKARREGEELKSAIDRLPPLPGTTPSAGTPGVGLPAALAGTDIFVAVNSRPVGKIVQELSSLRFRPTPLQFFKRLS